MPTLFISGFGSGAGKSTVCQAIIHLLLTEQQILPVHIAYIKPVTQCEALTDVVAFCQQRGVAATGLGPVVFAPGVTNSVIAAADFVQQRQQLLAGVTAAVAQLQAQHPFVIIDGVGYPAVGSCCGVGNGDVAAALGCPVVLVAPAGLGDAIDTAEQMLAYFRGTCGPSAVQAVVFNKCRDTARHKMDAVQPLVRKYFQTIRPEVAILGFLPATDNSGVAEGSVAAAVSASVDIAGLRKLLGITQPPS